MDRGSDFRLRVLFTVFRLNSMVYIRNLCLHVNQLILTATGDSQPYCTNMTVGPAETAQPIEMPRDIKLPAMSLSEAHDSLSVERSSSVRHSRSIVAATVRFARRRNRRRVWAFLAADRAGTCDLQSAAFMFPRPHA